MEWLNHDFFHVRRDWNASADMLAGQALQRQGGVDVQLQDLVTLNRLNEVMRRSSLDEDSPIHEPERKTGSLSRQQKRPTEETNDVARVQAVVTRSTDRQQVTPRSEAPELRTQVPSPRRNVASNGLGWNGSASLRMKKFGWPTS
ncbi:unnamed protein product [Phytophthora fragariaefolia]|uniref:Unnamed protein product n=1 Tax=Phytophthora fragariaefolia TaxID=1490495 RepID=A0A9W6X3G3_9STRA|nr:unnamed protein product [Phytophthora fragariaefolia]